MKALKRFSGTRSQRDKRHAVSDTTEYFKYAAAIILHDEFGFGPKRLTRFYEKLLEIFEGYTERYESGYLLTAMKKQCADRGITFKE